MEKCCSKKIEMLSILTTSLIYVFICEEYVFFNALCEECLGQYSNYCQTMQRDGLVDPR